MATQSTVDVVVIGAGAAGIGAARTLAQQGLSLRVVEASHRIGGRGYTEEVKPGEPFDLGCHWLHSASINPMVAFADEFGFHYVKEPWSRETFRDGAWQSDAQNQAREDYIEATYAAMHRFADEGKDLSIYECMDRDSPWAEALDYWFSLDTSADPDQVSMLDLVRYHDTGEDWPVRDGYGALLARLGAAIPVELNCAAEVVRWEGDKTRVHTVKGTIESKATIVTVSNGVLGADDIEFSPRLPVWKREAIAAVPLGNHNRICLHLDRNVFGETPDNGVNFSANGGAELSLRIRPFGFNQIIGVTGGRFADWLERAGARASADYVLECVVKMFGAAVRRHVVSHTVTAWRSDPWVKGAYAAARPGQHQQRANLRKSLGERLFFAGEAVSDGFQATAHGAYLSGVDTAQRVAARLTGSLSADQRDNIGAQRAPEEPHDRY